MKKEFEILDEFIQGKRLRHSPQRDKILKIFLSTERHVSCEELYKLVRKNYREIGFTTVYRTMKLFCESGLCSQIDLGDGLLRYEHKYGHQHHDHLICLKCGRFIEVKSPRIERLQDKMARAHKFRPLSHKLDIFGLCQKCS